MNVIVVNKELIKTKEIKTRFIHTDYTSARVTLKLNLV